MGIEQLDESTLERLARVDALDRVHRAWVHDLNGSANALALQYELARAAGGADAARLEKLDRLSRRHRDAVTALLALARPPVDPVAPFDLRDVLTEVVAVCGSVASTRRVTLELTDPPSMTLTAQPQHVRLALARVVLDAIERAAPSTIPIEIASCDEGVRLSFEFDVDPTVAEPDSRPLTDATLGLAGASFDERRLDGRVRVRLGLPGGGSRR